jgi:hypothetical protein
MRKKANHENLKAHASSGLNEIALIQRTFTPWTEEKHAAAAHDLPIVCDLFMYHTLSFFATYECSDLDQHRKLAVLAYRAEKEVHAFVEAMAKMAKQEHPGAVWLSGYHPHEETQPGEVWPPRITRIKG